MAIYSSKPFKPALLLAALLAACSAPPAPLAVQAIDADTWLVQGAAEEFSPDNRGHISNITIVNTGAGVLLVDSGGSEAVGTALAETVAALTDEPVRWIVLTHHHPDHVFGAHAFPQADTLMLAGAWQDLQRYQHHYLDTLATRLAPEGSSQPPAQPFEQPPRLLAPGRHRFGDREFELLELHGHSGADAVLYEPARELLITGDMVFWQRAPATAHTPSLAAWIQDLDQLATLPVRHLVPGHGPLTDARALAANQRWLQWLDQLLKQSAEDGLSTNEMLDHDLPAEFADWPLARYELTRSASHFYPAYEERAFADSAMAPKGEKDGTEGEKTPAPTGP